MQLLSPPPQTLQATHKQEQSTGPRHLASTQSVSLHKSKFLLHPPQELKSNNGFLLDGSSVMLPPMLTTSAPQPLPLALQLEHSPQVPQAQLLFQRPTFSQSQVLRPLLLLVRLQQRPPTSLGEHKSGIKAACHCNARQPAMEQTLGLSSLE